LLKVVGNIVRIVLIKMVRAYRARDVHIVSPTGKEIYTDQEEALCSTRQPPYTWKTGSSARCIGFLLKSAAPAATQIATGISIPIARKVSR
jgi:hypothetical protein